MATYLGGQSRGSREKKQHVKVDTFIQIQALYHRYRLRLNYLKRQRQETSVVEATRFLHDEIKE